MRTNACMINGVRYTVCTTNTNLNQRRVLSLSGENPASAALIGNLDSHAAIGTQDYRGLKFSVQRRAADSVSLNANYTWSRCFGLEMPPNAQFGTGFTDPANPEYDRGHCDADRTHLANSDDVYGAKTLNAYLNRAAFAQPASGTFGNHERNSIRGPGFWKIDLAVSRLVQTLSTHTLELRVEVFNLTNNFNWGNPTLNFGAGTFGRITSMATNADPRIMQFGVKYGF